MRITEMRNRMFLREEGLENKRVIQVDVESTVHTRANRKLTKSQPSQSTIKINFNSKCQFKEYVNLIVNSFLF